MIITRCQVLRFASPFVRRHRSSPVATKQGIVPPFHRLASTLVVLESKNGSLSADSLSAVAAATQISGPVTGLIVGNGIAAESKAPREAAGFAGLKGVLVPRDAESHDYRLPEHAASLVTANVRDGGYTHVVAAHSVFGRDVIPRAAAILGVQPISSVTAIVGEEGDTFSRPIYAGNAIMTVQSTEAIKLLTIRPSSFSASELETGKESTIKEAVDPEGTDGARACRLVGEELVESDRPALGTASRVVSGGRGLKSKEDFDSLMMPLADSLGAAVGASRAAVDSGYADNSLQVGQTGAVVAPDLYIAVGISGAIQHLAGMKDSKVIAAVNKDPDAPIFQVADVGMVGDLYEAVPQLTEQLNAQAGKE